MTYTYTDDEGFDFFIGVNEFQPITRLNYFASVRKLPMLKYGCQGLISKEALSDPVIKEFIRECIFKPMKEQYLKAIEGGETNYSPKHETR